MPGQEKWLGKITSAEFGVREGRYGLFVTLSSENAGVQDNICSWDYSQVECSEFTSWNEESRTLSIANDAKRISAILKDAKVQYISGLLNKPIEVTIESNMLESWRILTEVL